MVHVHLDELEGLVLDHLDGLGIEELAQVAELFSGDSIAVLGALEGLLQDGLHVSQALNAVTHAQAEVTEPLVVESHGPVLGEELHHIRNDALLETRGKGV